MMNVGAESGVVMDQTVGGPRRLAVRDVIDHVTCRLCSGYLIDATTVVECLHSCEFECLTLCFLTDWSIQMQQTYISTG